MSLDDVVVALRGLLDRFRHRSPGEAYSKADLQPLVAKSRIIFDKLEAALSDDFSLFSVLGLRCDDELLHSRVLAWLLDRRREHGRDSLFFQAFLKAAGIVLPSSAISTYRVQLEWAREESRIDVSAYQKEEFVVFIENKTLSDEGDEQLHREESDMERLANALRVPRARQFLVFLTPHGRPPETGNPSKWHCMSYGDLQQAVVSILPCGNGKANALVRDWLQLTEQLRKEGAAQHA